MRLIAIPLALALALAACSKKAAESEASRDVTEVAALKAGGPAGPTDASQPPARTRQAGLPRLAYTYSYEILAPTKAVRGLAAAHEAACMRAGAAVCQVRGSSVSQGDGDNVSARLSLTATPAWLAGFRARLAEQARGAGGRLSQAATDTEDLSLQIIDTEATLRAKTILRDRLQTLLATRAAKVSDLVEAETALAKVQGEIDATQSALAVLRDRVETSKLEISYQSKATAASAAVWRPLQNALTGALGMSVTALAALITAVAFLAPWALVIGSGAWLLRKWRPRRGVSPPPGGT